MVITSPDQALIDQLKCNHSSMIEQLYRFCEINSSSANLSGLTTLREQLTAAFHPIADHIETVHFPELPAYNLQGESVALQCGPALIIKKRPECKRRVLLSGHMDTVYAQENPFQKLTELSSNCINGPGVADMKGGLIVMLHALTAFEQTTVAPELGWDVLINSDEELGSPASGNLLSQMAGEYQAGLVYEPALAQGYFARNRKGSGKFTLIATGRPAHAGRAFNEGRNAICYLAEVLLAIDQLNGQRAGVTINIGLISGGEALNIVPGKATAKLDIRIENHSDIDWFNSHLEAIMVRLERSDYSLRLHGAFSRPVKKINSATIRLFNQIKAIGSSMNLTLDWQDSGGCCDGNNLSAQGLAVLDTLGVRGGAIHSAKEYIELDSLVERASLSALLLTHLAQGGLEELAL